MNRKPQGFVFESQNVPKAFSLPLMESRKILIRKGGLRFSQKGGFSEREGKLLRKGDPTHLQTMNLIQLR